MANLLVPFSLVVISWLVVQILARRNERRLQAEWRDFVQNYEEWEPEDAKSLPSPDEADSWGVFSKRCFTVQIIRTAEPPIIRFVYGALSEYFPNHCWVCQKLMLERDTRYRKDDVQHFLEEERLWLPFSGSLALTVMNVLRLSVSSRTTEIKSVFHASLRRFCLPVLAHLIGSCQAQLASLDKNWRNIWVSSFSSQGIGPSDSFHLRAVRSYLPSKILIAFS